METKDIFEQMALRYDTDDRIEITKIIANEIRAKINNAQGKSALDYGCGSIMKAKMRVRRPVKTNLRVLPVLVAAILLIAGLGGCTTGSSGGETSGHGDTIQGHTLVFTENDGLYALAFEAASASGGSAGGEVPGAGEPEKIADGAGIEKPIFSEDGSAVAYLQNGDLYTYTFTDKTARLLAAGVLSCCAGEGDAFYVSTRENGVTRIHASETGSSDVILPADEHSAEGWMQYEHLSLSPDKEKLAFSKFFYTDRQDPAKRNFQQDLGVWYCDPADSGDDGNPPETLIRQGSGYTADEFWAAAELYENSLTLAYPGKWSPDSGRLFI
ncbi:MAG: hypothetical protein LBT34_03390 [Clostridiales Family XIII bacterium]|jgi:hypothetical protein|nr:hypothetical protein [Clostridiales Family XIII bacterium]